MTVNSPTAHTWGPGAGRDGNTPWHGAQGTRAGMIMQRRITAHCCKTHTEAPRLAWPEKYSLLQD